MSERLASSTLLQAPKLLRALVRADEVWLALLATVVGICAGFGVVLINALTLLMHTLLFHLSAGQGLSESESLDPVR
ncbi:chloride channel protein, partial [Acidocella sp. KAb 2-4]|nr:chloride channel protein [Acidocella sp. KAb 2-4]